MEFNSQICTTKEQSERLLALGLKAETADMYTTDMSSKGINYTDDWKIGSIPYCNAISFLNGQGLQLEKTAWSIIPTWSLHRLMSLCPDKLGPDDGGERAKWDMYAPDEYRLQVSHDLVQYLDDGARYGGERLNCFCGEGNVYNAIIKCIEWLIKEGYFNKEYLDEGAIL